jgi:hypothetical protein
VGKLLERNEIMEKTDTRVDNHLILTNDGKCGEEGHELIPRACIHCGMTIHQISDANNSTIPTRDTPAERAERKKMIDFQLKCAEDAVSEALDRVEEVLGWYND